MGKSDKIIWAIAGLIALAVVLIVFYNGGKDDALIVISADGSFTEEQCLDRGFENKVIMLESKYCGHCRETKPVFLEACNGGGVEPIVLDISERKDRAEMDSYGVEIRYTPTFIFGCDYYVGVQSGENYKNYIDELGNDG
ncbi:MAG: thioredoxin family protein [archaeon]